MGRSLIPRCPAAAQVSSFSDAELHELASNIVTSGKTSPIVQGSTTLQATVAALATDDASLTTANKTVEADKNQLRLDVTAAAQARSLVVGGVRSVITAVTNVAKSPADLQAAGIPPAPPRPPANQPPTVPAQIDVTYPKTWHGKARATVFDTDPTRYAYVAQQSADGTNWTQLGVGHGKMRTVTGASGTKVWVRFAMVRAQLQSDWSAPVLVTIP
jgi:hypothetical protein